MRPRFRRAARTPPRRAPSSPPSHRPRWRSAGAPTASSRRSELCRGDAPQFRGGAISISGARNAVTMNRTSLSVERRRFLSGVTSAATGLIAVGISRAQTDVGAHLAVAYEEAGQPIASDFIGLSYESAILAAGDYFVPDNDSV